jgi:hypothetical protein
MEMTFDESLDALVNWPLDISIMLGGNQGLGKTSCCYKAGEVRSKLINAPCPVVVLRLSQKMAGDIIGMPYQVDGRTVFAPPDWFPIRASESLERMAFCSWMSGIEPLWKFNRWVCSLLKKRL